jgi:hypothetical protein
VSTITRRPHLSTISIRPGAATGHVEEAEVSALSRRAEDNGELLVEGSQPDNRRRKRRGLIGLDMATLSGQPPPHE